MTDLKQHVDEVLALQQKATPGPWHFTVDEVNSTVSVMGACIEYAVDGLEYKTSGCVAMIDGEFFDQDLHDAAFIISAHKMADLLREQQAEIERLRKDAERYRWLRKQEDSVADGRIDVCLWSNGDGADDGEALRGAQLDEAVDAAIEREQSTGGRT